MLSPDKDLGEAHSPASIYQEKEVSIEIVLNVEFMTTRKYLFTDMDIERHQLLFGFVHHSHAIQ